LPDATPTDIPAYRTSGKRIYRSASRDGGRHRLATMIGTIGIHRSFFDKRSTEEFEFP
jgi:hypothetical protein